MCLSTHAHTHTHRYIYICALLTSHTPLMFQGVKKMEKHLKPNHFRSVQWFLFMCAQSVRAEVPSTAEEGRAARSLLPDPAGSLTVSKGINRRAFEVFPIGNYIHTAKTHRHTPQLRCLFCLHFYISAITCMAMRAKDLRKHER